MKKLKHPCVIAFALILSVTTSGCLGDKGNTLDSYDAGTVTEISGQECIKLDNINISISGAGMPQYSANPITRCFCTFHIDWDNQPDNASSTGIYSATINTLSVWNVDDFLSTAVNPFAGSDSLVNISQPYLTDLTSSKIITFQTNTYDSETATFQLVLQEKDDDNATITMNLIYIGTNEDESKTHEQWHSFTLPTIDKTYTLNIRFKSHTTPSFNALKYTDPAAPENNTYIYSTTYAPLNSNE